MRRGLVYLAVAIAAVAAFVALAHLPMARLMVLRWGLQALHSRAGIDVTVRDVSYNLLTLDVHLRGLTATAVGSSIPFVTAEEVSVNLPWGAAFGSTAVERLAARGLAVDIVRAADGTLNLPKGGDRTPGATTPRIVVGGLVLADARFRYRDMGSRFSLDMSGVNLTMTPADNGVISGRLSTAAGPALRAQNLSVDGTVTGSLAYDGSALTLDGVSYRSTVGELRTSGRLDALWGTPRATLMLDAAVELARLSTALSIEPPLGGRVMLHGPLTGELTRLVATLTATSDRLQWRHVTPQALAAGVVLTPDAVRIDEASLQLGGGTVSSSGGLVFESGTASIDATWQGVPLDAIVDEPLSGSLAARLTGRTSLTWDTSRGIQGLTGRIETRVETMAAARGTAVEGTAQLNLSGETWNLHSNTIVGGTLSLDGALSGRLRDAELANSSLEGTLSAAGDAAPLERLAARFAGTESGARIGSGRVTATMDASGTLGAPRVTGEVHVEGLRVAGSDRVDGVLPFTATPAEVRVTAAQATSGANRLNGNVAVNLMTRALVGDADVALPELGALGPNVIAWHPGGSVTGRVSISGTTRAPVVRATIAGSDLTVAGQPASGATLDVGFEDGVVRAAPVELTQVDGGRVTGEVSYVPATGRSEISLRTTGWRVSRIESPAGSWPVSGLVDGTLEAAGTIEHPTGAGTITLTGVQWQDARIDQVAVGLTLSDAGVAAVAQIPSLALGIDARVGQQAPHQLTAVVTASDTSVAAVLTALGPLVPQSLTTVTGVAAGGATVSGPLDDPSSLSADIRLTRLELQQDAARLRLARQTSAQYSGTALTVQDLRLESGMTTADVSGALGPGAPGLTMVLRGTLADAAPWLAATGAAPDVTLGGTFDATLGATGPLEQLVLRGSLAVDQGRVERTGYPAATGITGTVTLENGVVSTPAIRATWAEAAIQGDVRLPLSLLGDWLPPGVRGGLPAAAREPATARLRIDHITPTALAPFAGDAIGAGLSGAFSLDVDLRADGRTPDQVNGMVQMRELDMTAQGLPITQAQPTRVDIAGGVARIAAWEWDVAGSRLTVAGQANLSGTQALDFTAGGALDLRVLSAFLPDVATAGVGDLALTVKGTASAPAFDGTVRLRGAELQLRDPAISLSNVNGLVALRPATIDVTGLEGELNGGRVAIIGGVSYEGTAVTKGALSMHATGVALDAPRGLRTEIDASLALTMGARPLLSGQIDIVRGAYREPLSLAVELASITRVRAAAPVERPSMLDSLDLNVRLASRDPLIVDNNYGRMDLAVDVRLVGTASVPSIVGRATIAEGGVLYLGGRSYLVDRGVIDFTNPRAIVPDLDLQARARIRGTDESNLLRDYDVTVSITGTPDTVKATLSSDPPRSQADLVSLVATGRLADQVGGAGAAVAREEALGYLSGDALAFAARAVGLDAIRFERDPGVDSLNSDPSLSGEVNPVQRLTFSQRLTSQLNVTLSQNLVDTGLMTWILGYMPRPSIELRAISKDDRSRSYQARHDLSFGGPPAGAQRPAETRPIRVAAIRMAGELRFDERDLRSELHLTPGSRFDYFRWQEDRDRLRAFYTNRGYREARVSARRVENITDDPTVTLDYDVVPGPLTHLDLEGHPLPSRVVRELETIWTDAIIDVSLVADLTDAVRRHLAEDGYLQAKVEATRQPAAPGEKRIRITVNEGPHASSRRFVFSGHMHVTEQELRMMADAIGIEAWVRPTRLSDEIAAQYRQRGLLAASVTAGPIENPAADATLPVRIVEGEPFVIGQVTVRGAARRTEAAALKDLSLMTGLPYTPAAVRTAQADLEAGYARDGYNAVVTSVDTAVEPARSRVDVAVTVEEGPQQVLLAVDITGAQGLSDNVLAKALGLKVSDPVNLTDWYTSRRRLFQTGLFRRVDLEPVPVDDTGTAATQPVRAAVSLVRRAPWHLRYGVEVSDEVAPLDERARAFAAGLSVDVERYGVWGRPGTVGGALRLNPDHRLGRVFVTLPSLFGESAATNVFVTRSRDDFESVGFTAFVTDRSIVSAEQRFLIRPTIQAAFGYQFERNHVFEPDPDPGALLPLDARLQQTRLTSTIVWDTRNDPFDAHNGQFHSSNLEYGPELGSDVRFIKYSLQQYLFREPVAGLVTASAIRVGLARGYGQGLIPSERFFAGGGTTVRGFADNALGSRDFFGDPRGGGGMLVLNQELRVPVYRWVRAVGFLDAGSIFDQARMISIRDLDVAAGAGVRVRTPIGLVRLDVAAPVRVASPVPLDQRGTRWWFSFGQAF